MRDRLDWQCGKAATLMPFRTRLVSVSFVTLLVCAAVGLRVHAQVPADDRGSGNHGQGHAENHDWYKELKQPGTGYSCCNGTVNGIEGDCRPTRAYLQDDGTWRALIDGRWVLVPPRVVLKQLAPDGNSHICASRSGLIYCFLGGSPKS
jgi:hypothetical protein